MSFKSKVILTPGTPFWDLRQELEKLNSVQFEALLKSLLAESNVKVTRQGRGKTACNNFRIGTVAGLFLGISVIQNIEQCLTHKDPCIQRLALVLATILHNDGVNHVDTESHHSTGQG